MTVWLTDWKNPGTNDFAVAEEVTMYGVQTKRSDLALYVNGIVFGVLELKRSTVAVSEGIRQSSREGDSLWHTQCSGKSPGCDLGYLLGASGFLSGSEAAGATADWRTRCPP